MPWRKCKPMDERIRFVARLQDSEKMEVVRQECGIGERIWSFSRNTTLKLAGAEIFWATELCDEDDHRQEPHFAML